MSLLLKQQQMRKARLSLLLNVIKSLETVEYNKLLGLMAVNYGLSSDLTKKYLKELEDCDFIITNNGVISITDQTKKLQTPEIQKAEIEVNKLEKEMLEAT